MATRLVREGRAMRRRKDAGCAVGGLAGRRRGDRLLARCVASFAVCLVAASGRTGERFQPTRAGVAATVPRAIGTTAGGGMASLIPGTAPVTRTSTLTIRAGRVGACVTFQLKLSRGVSGVATGTSYTWYIFTNVGRAACSMIGYPGVAILDAHGRVVQHPAVWSTHPGTMPPEAIRLVVLAVGQHARFVLASTDVTPSRGCRAPYSGRTLQVFPPNQTTALRAPYHGSFCNLAVGPVHRLPTQVARMCTRLGGERRAMPPAFATRRRDPPGGTSDRWRRPGRPRRARFTARASASVTPARRS